MEKVRKGLPALEMKRSSNVSVLKTLSKDISKLEHEIFCAIRTLTLKNTQFFKEYNIDGNHDYLEMIKYNNEIISDLCDYGFNLSLYCVENKIEFLYYELVEIVSSVENRIISNSFVYDFYYRYLKKIKCLVNEIIKGLEKEASECES